MKKKVTNTKNTFFKEVYSDFLKISRKTSVKIAIVVSLAMLTLLALLNLVVIERSKDTFVNVIKTITIGPVDGGNIVLEREEVRQYNILHFFQDGTERPTPLQEEFVEQFQASLISVSLIAIVVSLVIGFVSSQIFTRPLRSLSSGMRNLRNNDYNLRLKNIGSEEFDEVICEFNRLTDELSKVESLRKDLISDTSHELKTPITSLLGQLNGIKEGVFELDGKRTDLLINQVERLAEIVNRLQEFSRIQSNQIKIKKKRIEFLTFLKNIFSQFEQDLKNNKIKQKFNIDKGFVVNGDEYLLEQVFSNLIQNAIKYSKASKIIVTANEKLIEFTDDGIGIADTDKPYIFERFYRVEKSRNRKTGGLGLGLAIVKEIVESHGWKIKVKDNIPRGTKFIISLQ